MNLSKIIQPLLPKILTERILLGASFIILFTEDYLLFGYHTNLAWLNDTLPKLKAEEGLYFILALAFSLVVILPGLKAASGIAWIYLGKPRSQPDPFNRLTGTELLNLAVNNQNKVAYEHFRAHNKLVKEQKLVRDFYFYIAVAVAVNMRYAGSLMQQIFSFSPLICISLLFIVACLGLVIGVGGTVNNDDNRTDVRPK